MKKAKSNKPINFLFTSIGNDSHLFEAFRSAYTSLRATGKIISADIDPYCAGLYLADKGYVVPRLESPKFPDRIAEIIAKEEISLIIPTRDEDVMYFAKNRKQFEKLGTKIMVPSLKTASICNNKWKFYQFLKARNFRPVESFLTPPKNLRFPCVLKPTVGSGGRGLEIIANEKELRAQKLVGKIIQEKIEGTEYTIDYFADFSGKVISIIPRIRLKVVGGESKVGITKNEKDVINLARKIGRALGLVGHNNIQCFRLKNGRLEFLEANARFGGGTPLAMAAGGRSAEYLIRLLRGEKVPEQKKFQANLVMMRYSKDLFIPNEKIINL